MKTEEQQKDELEIEMFNVRQKAKLPDTEAYEYLMCEVARLRVIEERFKHLKETRRKAMRFCCELMGATEEKDKIIEELRKTLDGFRVSRRGN